MSINKPGTGEKPAEKSTVLGRITQKLKDTFAMPNQEEAWNNFPEEAKKEMLESLEKQDDFDLYSIDLSDICFGDVSRSRGDFPRFQDGVVQKDEIGNYITINGMKCREWQPGISGFTYEDINDRYHHFSWLKIGFCEKGTFKKEIITDDMGRIPTFDLPDDVVEELGGPFYEVNDQITDGSLADVKWDDVYTYNRDDGELSIRELSDSRYTQKPYKKNDKNWKDSVLTINGTEFKPFKKGASGFIYKEISDDDGDRILMAEYKDGKMVGKGLVLNPSKRTCIISKK